jgi:hypothetical protein
MRRKILFATLILCIGVGFAAAQGTGERAQGTGERIQSGRGQQGRAVATQPSDNPFVNPIGQGVPPAVSTNPRLNDGRTSVPLNPPNGSPNR